jgi:hypothetical protein
MTLLKEFRKALKLVHSLFKLRVVKVIIVLVLVFAALPWVIFYTLKPEPAKEITFGANFSKKYAEQLEIDWQDTYLKILDDLQIKNLRLVAYWDDIEKERGQYDFSDVIWQLEEAQKHDAKVILTIGRKVPRFPECYEPDWWHHINDWERKEDALLAYVAEAVTELKDYESIVMWQVENEPHFPFGICERVPLGLLDKEIAVVKSLDTRPIITQDSGESGLWLPSYKEDNYLGISMYRKVWFDFWAIVTGGKFPYFKYPLGSWAYDIKADLLGIPVEHILVKELQAEPWGPDFVTTLTEEEKNKTMSKQDFIDTLSYAQTSGFSEFYFWGPEWWLWEKEYNNNPFFWDTAKAIVNALPAQTQR